MQIQSYEEKYFYYFILFVFLLFCPGTERLLCFFKIDSVIWVNNDSVIAYSRNQIDFDPVAGSKGTVVGISRKGLPAADPVLGEAILLENTDHILKMGIRLFNNDSHSIDIVPGDLAEFKVALPPNSYHGIFI